MVALLLAALFIRVYRLDASLIEWHTLPVALGARDLLHGGTMPLISPQAIGTLGHYGPALEYFLVPFFLISQSFSMFHLALVLTNIAAIYFLYRLGRDFFNRDVGWLSAILFGFSWFTLNSSRRGFNPDFVPLFAILLFYALAQVISLKRRHYIILISVCLAMLLQLHFTAFPALPAALLVLVAGYSRDKERKKWLRPLVIGAAIFFLMFLPYLVFEYQNGFRETAMRLQFARGILLGGDSRLQPQDSLPAIVRRNTQGFFAFNQGYNPFGRDLNKDYLCEPSLAGGGWTGLLYQIHWVLTRGECALALIAFAIMLGSALFGRSLPFSRAHVFIVLLWFISGVTVLLIQSTVGNPHQTFVFAPMVLIISMFFSWVPSLWTRWGGAVRAGIFGFCVLLAFSSSILFVFATARVADTSCVIASFAGMTVGALVDLQEQLLSEFGTVPPIYFFCSAWRPMMPFNLITQPKQAPPPSALSNLTFFFLKNADVPPGCVLSDFTYSRKEGTLVGISSPAPAEIKYSSRYYGGWYLNEFDDSHWLAHANEGVVTFHVGDNPCNECQPSVNHGPLFLRYHLPNPSLANAILIMFEPVPTHSIEAVYVNGNMLFGKEPPLTHATGLLIDVTEDLRERDNLLAVKIDDFGEMSALSPDQITIGAFLVRTDSCSSDILSCVE